MNPSVLLLFFQNQQKNYHNISVIHVNQYIKIHFGCGASVNNIYIVPTGRKVTPIQTSIGGAKHGYINKKVQDGLFMLSIILLQNIGA